MAQRTFEVTVPIVVTVVGGRAVKAEYDFRGWGGFFSDAEENAGCFNVDHQEYDFNAHAVNRARSYVDKLLGSPLEIHQ